MPTETIMDLRNGNVAYWEPFLGSGAMYFWVRPHTAWLEDACPQLVTTYLAVRDDLGGVVRELNSLAELEARNAEGAYYFSRARFNRLESPPAESAADMIFLNRAGFNGLWRVDSKGRYNVSWGKRTAAAWIETCGGVLSAASRRLQRAVVQLPHVPGQYGIGLDATYRIKPDAGTFIYLDPPYPGGFTRYTPGGWNEDLGQQRVLDYVNHATVAGAKVMLSYPDTERIRSDYAAYHVTELDVHHCISGKASGRAQKRELVITNFAPEVDHAIEDVG